MRCRAGVLLFFVFLFFSVWMCAYSLHLSRGFCLVPSFPKKKRHGSSRIVEPGLGRLGNGPWPVAPTGGYALASARQQQGIVFLFLFFYFLSLGYFLFLGSACVRFASFRAFLDQGLSLPSSFRVDVCTSVVRSLHRSAVLRSGLHRLVVVPFFCTKDVSPTGEEHGSN